MHWFTEPTESWTIKTLAETFKKDKMVEQSYQKFN